MTVWLASDASDGFTGVSLLQMGGIRTFESRAALSAREPDFFSAERTTSQKGLDLIPSHLAGTTLNHCHQQNHQTNYADT